MKIRSGLMSPSLARIANGENTILLAFRARRATGGREALSLPELGLNDSDVLKQLVASSIVRRAGPDRYFLDEKAWAGRRQVSGKIFFRVAVVIVLIGAILAVL